ncbi:MAG TPA: sigma-70 family RNA polymerase sigma factor [Thermomicrobiales bacterium]|nr:sigma-70 family RNA polymerase sigma factor [Thermomicrobiales bacterium]
MVFRRATKAQPPPDPTADQDERLILSAARGDLDAFNQLVTRHERSVLNLCWRMLGTLPEAEDASQDSFIKAWTNAKSFKGGAVRPWLLRIATNTCYDVLRSKGRKPTGSLDALEFESEPGWSTQSDPVDPVRFAETGDLSRLLEAALAQIPDEQRLAVTLCDIQGLPLAEAAEVMEISLGTVKSRLFRGRAKLRDLLVASPAGRELLLSAERSSSRESE